MDSSMKTMATMVAAATLALVCAPKAADAFCGFYVSGADAELYNNATQVVMMRDGTRTVLSMANNYQGPPSNFAMVIPVPVVLQEENVKTLSNELFKRVDQLAAPRLVEYWEMDPCSPQIDYASRGMPMPMKSAAVMEGAASDKEDLGVTVEAQFDVGEYQIVILSARDSGGLDTWLRREKYTIPAGAEAFLRPYVSAGSKFFVAKVNAQKVKFKDGMAALSPLRFFYDSEEFSLPVRLGLMNAKGKQDLIVHILSPRQRYEVANYKNVTIPTNLDVVNDARGRFGEFYAALFDRTLEENKGAVVTEYSWDAASCDPCPTPPLTPGDLMTLGQDVLDVPFKTKAAKKKPTAKPPKDAVDELTAKPSTGPAAMPRRPRPPVRFRQFVLTRLHARYDATTMKEDLVFKKVSAIAGGREVRSGQGGTLENGSTSAGVNNFQARYAIRHAWEGKIECANPVRGRWGGPPAGKSAEKAQAALDLAFAPRGAKLAQLVKQDIPEIGIKAGEDPASAKPSKSGEPATPATDSTDKPAAKKKGCGCTASGGDGLGGFALFGFVLIGLIRSRRSRRHS